MNNNNNNNNHSYNEVDVKNIIKKINKSKYNQKYLIELKMITDNIYRSSNIRLSRRILIECAELYLINKDINNSEHYIILYHQHLEPKLCDDLMLRSLLIEANMKYQIIINDNIDHNELIEKLQANVFIYLNRLFDLLLSNKKYLIYIWPSLSLVWQIIKPFLYVEDYKDELVQSFNESFKSIQKLLQQAIKSKNLDENQITLAIIILTNIAILFDKYDDFLMIIELCGELDFEKYADFIHNTLNIQMNVINSKDIDKIKKEWLKILKYGEMRIKYLSLIKKDNINVKDVTKLTENIENLLIENITNKSFQLELYEVLGELTYYIATHKKFNKLLSNLIKTTRKCFHFGICKGYLLAQLCIIIENTSHINYDTYEDGAIDIQERWKLVELAEELLPGVISLKNDHQLIERVCVHIWNLILPLFNNDELINDRLAPLLNMCTKALDSINSNLLTLYQLYHYEAARINIKEDYVSKALEHLNKCVYINLYQPNIYFDNYIEPVYQELITRINVNVKPKTTFEKAVLMFEEILSVQMYQRMNRLRTLLPLLLECPIKFSIRVLQHCKQWKLYDICIDLCMQLIGNNDNLNDNSQMYIYFILINSLIEQLKERNLYDKKILKLLNDEEHNSRAIFRLLLQYSYESIEFSIQCKEYWMTFNIIAITWNYFSPIIQMKEEPNIEVVIKYFQNIIENVYKLNLKNNKYHQHIYEIALCCIIFNKSIEHAQLLMNHIKISESKQLSALKIFRHLNFIKLKPGQWNKELCYNILNDKPVENIDDEGSEEDSKELEMMEPPLVTSRSVNTDSVDSVHKYFIKYHLFSPRIRLNYARWLLDSNFSFDEANEHIQIVLNEYLTNSDPNADVLLVIQAKLLLAEKSHHNNDDDRQDHIHFAVSCASRLCQLTLDIDMLPETLEEWLILFKQPIEEHEIKDYLIWYDVLTDVLNIYYNSLDTSDLATYYLLMNILPKDSIYNIIIKYKLVRRLQWLGYYEEANQIYELISKKSITFNSDEEKSLSSILILYMLSQHGVNNDIIKYINELNEVDIVKTIYYLSIGYNVKALENEVKLQSLDAKTPLKWCDSLYSMIISLLHQAYYNQSPVYANNLYFQCDQILKYACETFSETLFYDSKKSLILCLSLRSLCILWKHNPYKFHLYANHETNLLRCVSLMIGKYENHEDNDLNEALNYLEVAYNYIKTLNEEYDMKYCILRWYAYVLFCLKRIEESRHILEELMTFCENKYQKNKNCKRLLNDLCTCKVEWGICLKYQQEKLDNLPKPNISKEQQVMEEFFEEFPEVFGVNEKEPEENLKEMMKDNWMTILKLYNINLSSLELSTNNIHSKIRDRCRCICICLRELNHNNDVLLKFAYDSENWDILYDFYTSNNIEVVNKKSFADIHMNVAIDAYLWWSNQMLKRSVATDSIITKQYELNSLIEYGGITQEIEKLYNTIYKDVECNKTSWHMYTHLKMIEQLAQITPVKNRSKKSKLKNKNKHKSNKKIATTNSITLDDDNQQHIFANTINLYLQHLPSDGAIISITSNYVAIYVSNSHHVFKLFNNHDITNEILKYIDLEVIEKIYVCCSSTLDCIDRITAAFDSIKDRCQLYYKPSIVAVCYEQIMKVDKFDIKNNLIDIDDNSITTFQKNWFN